MARRGGKRRVNAVMRALEALALQHAPVPAQPAKAGRSRRRRRNRRGGGRGNGPGVSGTLPAGYASGKMPLAPIVGCEAEGMRVKHCEFLTTLEPQARGVLTKPFKLGSTGLTMFDSLSAAYTRFNIHSMVVEYRPMVGTNTNGQAVVAVDWDASDAAPTEAKLRVMQPQIRGPVWQPGMMRLPVDRIQQKRNLLKDDIPFSFQLKVPTSGSNAPGEVVVSYDVTMMGPSGN